MQPRPRRPVNRTAGVPGAGWRPLAALCAVFLAGCTKEPVASFEVSVPWALTGRTLAIDTHTHTQFSDGSLSVEALAALAAEHGCDALAITDHTDHAVAATNEDYFAAVDAARQAHPSMTFFAGVEWNMPPYDGREHVTVLVEPRLERSVLPAFKAGFDGMQDAVDPAAALRWLAEQASPARSEVALIYNHPSRKDEQADENRLDYLQWREVNDLFIGFEGGPGHQRSGTPGAYRASIRPVDRWDPVVADTGGTWDQLLDQGQNVWGAIASSDFHEDRNDYAPCRFSRTIVTADSPDARGILRALRAGSFWAGHGRVLSNLWFIVAEPALPLPAAPGETVRLGPGAQPVFRVKVERSPEHLTLPLVVELIGNGLSGIPEQVARGELAPATDTFDWQPPQTLVAGADGRSAYFRARVTALDPKRGRLVAYTNPIRIVLAN